jgi:hypothetical protein
MALGAHKDSAIGCILIHFALNEANDAINIMNSVSSSRPVSADRCEEDLMFRVVCGVAAVVVWGAAAVAVGHAQPPKTPRIVTDRVTNYKVRQVVKLDDIKPGSKSIRMWVAIPDDEKNQSVLDLDVVSAARQMDHCQRSRKPGKVSPGGHCRSQESFTGSDGGFHRRAQAGLPRGRSEQSHAAFPGTQECVRRALGSKCAAYESHASE